MKKATDKANHRAQENPDDEFLREDVVKKETAVFKIKLEIERVCKDE